MAEAATLERNPIEDIQRARELRQRFNLKDSSNGELSTSDLQNVINAHLQRITEASDTTPESASTTEDPTFILRRESDWREYGWDQRDREEVSQLLEEVLGITNPHERENALQALVASGTTPEEAREHIRAEKLTAIRNKYIETDKDFIPVADKYAKKDILMALCNVRKDYIERFILPDDWQEERAIDFQRAPRNVEELAWNLMESDAKNMSEYGVNGSFPMLQMQIKRNEETGRVEGRYVFNKATFMKWIRDRINYWQDQSPNEVTNYFSQITIPKTTSYGDVHISIGSMLANMTYFTSENGKVLTDLVDQVVLEPWTVMTLRKMDIAYKQAMKDPKKLAEMFSNESIWSDLTRKAFQKSMMYYATTFPTDFQGKGSDSKMGEAWVTLLLAYYNIADFDALQKVLGAESSFFTKEGMMSAIKEVYGEKYTQTGLPEMGDPLGARAKHFSKAFDKNGNVTTKDQKEAFTTLVNSFTAINPNHNIMDVVSVALRNSIEDYFISKEGNVQAFLEQDRAKDVRLTGVVDKHTLGVLQLMAMSLIRFSGAGARSDIPNVAAYDSLTKWLYPAIYARKMATEKRGGAFGFLFEALASNGIATDFMSGTKVEESTITENGATRTLTPLEVFLQMREVTLEYTRKRRPYQAALQHASGEEKARILQVLKKLDREEERDYKIVAGQLEFNAESMKNYAENHIKNADTVYERIAGADALDFNKYNRKNIFGGGVSFDREAFQKDFQNGFIKPYRYLRETYGDINYNMTVRAPVFKGRDETGADKYEFESVQQWERIFGREMLDTPDFRKEFADIPLEEWIEMKKQGYRKKGKWIKDPQKRYVIDGNKVQQNQTTAWKNETLIHVAGQLFSHIYRNSTDPAYGMAYYINVIDALSSIPGEIEGDDTKLTKIKAVKPFYTEEQMKWFRELSRTTFYRLFTRHLIADFFGSLLGDDPRKKGSGGGEAFGLAVGSVFTSK